MEAVVSDENHDAHANSYATLMEGPQSHWLFSITVLT